MFLDMHHEGKICTTCFYCYGDRKTIKCILRLGDSVRAETAKHCDLYENKKDTLEELQDSIFDDETEGVGA